MGILFRCFSTSNGAQRLRIHAQDTHSGEAFAAWSIHHTQSAHIYLINFSNPASFKISTPSDFAFSNFDPGSAPTTT